MTYEQYLMHHGIRGQKWGERRFQNQDGSLTPEGRKRYGIKGLFRRANEIERKVTTAKYAKRLQKKGVKNPTYEDALNVRAYGYRHAVRIANAPDKASKKMARDRAVVDNLLMASIGIGVAGIMMSPGAMGALAGAGRSAAMAARNTAMKGKAAAEKLFSKYGVKIGDVVYTSAAEVPMYALAKIH